ncbi:MAG: SIMPL domain-containing protein [Anaerolineales bacterium]|nr:SIMPL domain-containing protein [Anaerolineales bacterium]
MTTKPDTIKISIMEKEEISATHADLHVTIKGTSLVSGSEAMKKAKEVNQLIEALTSLGLKSEAFFLQGVHLEQAGGALLKSSNAVYRLKIRCEDLEKLAAILDVISSQKNATLERIEWRYDEDETRQQLLSRALENAKKKAQQVANALGVNLIGVYDYLETPMDDEAPRFQMQAAPMFRGAAAPAEQNLGMDIQHTKTLHLHVDIWYRVSEFQD